MIRDWKRRKLHGKRATKVDMKSFLRMGPEALPQVWDKVKNLPRGGRIMSLLIGRMARYTGTIPFEILELSAGYARVRMSDTRRVRNHLGSVHAIALANLGEASSGLAFNMALPKGTRAILTQFHIDYLKKARGPITAECRCEQPSTSEQKDYDVEANLTDEAGDIVARVRATWRAGPRS